MKITDELKVFTSGNNKDKSVVFIHGFPFDHSMWDEQVSFLNKDYFCVTYDIRGLGKSNPGTGQYTIEMFTDDLFAIIDELKLNKPVVCGLSMGGYIALRAVEREQQRFSGLVLCDTKPQPDDNQGKLKRAAGIKRIDSAGIDGYMEDFMPQCWLPENITEMKDKYDAVLNRAKESSPLGVKGCLLAMAGRTDTTPFLEKITIPSLVLCGNNDKFTPPEQMRETAAKIQGAEIVISPRSGHLPPIENPSLVNDVLKGFLKRTLNM